MKIDVGRLNPSPACIICLCVPSPQSKRTSSPSRRIATDGRPLSFVGRLPPVPRKITSSPEANLDSSKHQDFPGQASVNIDSVAVQDLESALICHFRRVSPEGRRDNCAVSGWKYSARSRKKILKN